MKRFCYVFLLVIWWMVGCGQVDTPLVPVKGHIDSVRDTAKYFERSGNSHSALIYHYKVHSLSLQAGMKENQARALLDIGALIRQDSSDKSLVHLYDALNIAGQINHDRLRADIYLAISETYKRQQNFRDALSALETHRGLVDSLVIRDNQREMAMVVSRQHAELQKTISIAVIAVVVLVLAVFFYYYVRMRKLNSRLKELNGVKDQLFSVIGHDLRGPAGGLVQALEILDVDEFSALERKEMTQAMLRQGMALYDTVETLFRWAASQQNGITIRLEVFDPAVVAARSLSVLEGQARDKGVEISLVLINGLYISCDRDHFDFVVRNLVANAIKFSNQGDVVNVSFQVSGTEVVFAVADNGVGMSRSQIELVGSETVRSTFGTAGEKGTGLGLQLSRRMVSANHGKLWIESEIGKGTKVMFSAPLAH